MSSKKYQESLRKSLSLSICEYIKLRGMTQQQFAEVIGNHILEVRHWLSGQHNFSTSTLVRIQIVLNINLINVV